ncbi:unnamed protein product [Boreogadus saida]
MGLLLAFQSYTLTSLPVEDIRVLLIACLCLHRVISRVEGLHRPALRGPGVEALCVALQAISVSTEVIEEELRPHLDILLSSLLEKKKDAAVDIAKSGILPTLAQALRNNNQLSQQVALVVAEVAREASVREQCIQAGLVGALVPHLQSKEQEMLLNTGRAIGRICFDNAAQQEHLVQTGVIPLLVSIMQQYPENDPLVNVCLLALCNLADMGN